MSACAPLRCVCSISVVVFLSGCFATEDNESLVHDGAEVIHNKLSVEERSDGWELLFDGVSLDQWRGYGRTHATDRARHRRRGAPTHQSVPQLKACCESLQLHHGPDSHYPRSQNTPTEKRPPISSTRSGVGHRRS